MPLVAFKKPYVLVVEQDDVPPNPRENDCFGNMVCWHRKYDLGDKHNYKNPKEFLRSHIKNPSDTFGITELFAAVKNEMLILPLFLYDHSGLTMNTTGFSCPWDSGQIGWIYADMDKVKAEFGNCSNENLDKAKALLEREVEIYDCYLGDECYGFTLYNDGEYEDSCWGFLGNIDDVKKEIRDYLPENLRDIIDNLTYCETVNIEDLMEEFEEAV